MPTTQQLNGVSSVFTSEDVVKALRLRYPADAYAFIEGASNGTGAAATRFSDVIAMGLWPSRGLEIIGIEIKVHRGDWLRELPKGWGHLTLEKSGKMKCRVESKLETPPLFDRKFLAAVLRRVAEQCTSESSLSRARLEGKQEGQKEGRESGRYELERAQEELSAVQKLIKDFQETSGVFIGNRWSDGKKIGDAVNMVMRGGAMSAKQQLQQLLGTSKKCVQFIEDQLTSVKDE